MEYDSDRDDIFLIVKDNINFWNESSSNYNSISSSDKEDIIPEELKDKRDYRDSSIIGDDNNNNENK